MISLSNLLKQCYVVNSDGGKRIINSDQRLARSNSHNTDIDIHKELPIMPKLDGISAVPTGDPAKEIQKIKADAEKIRQVTLEVAKREAKSIIENAQIKAQQVLQEAGEKANQLMEEQKKIGYMEGGKEKEAALEAEYCEKEQGLETRKQELESQYEKNVNAMEGDIVDAVIQVFDKVFHIQFENKREILYSLVKNVLLDIEVGDEIRIHVNEENREIIEAHMDEIREIVGQKVAIEFVHDAKLKDDQCKIETSFGVFDCGIDTQLDNLLKDIKSLV